MGPDVNGACGGIDFGLAQGTMPYEGDGKGMPYEFNARGSAGGPHSRSSWHYANRGMHQYMVVLAAVAILGYWDPGDSLHQAALDRARHDDHPLSLPESGRMATPQPAAPSRCWSAVVQFGFTMGHD